MSDKLVAFKIGGSMLSTSDDQLFNFDYAFQLKQLFTELKSENYKILANVGGGFVTRKYQKLVEQNGEHDESDVHRIGIAATNLNTEILHGLLDDLAVPEIIRYSRYDELLSREKLDLQFDFHTVLMISPSQPGASNDYNILQAALKMGIKRIISAKNVDGVYTADPKLDVAATQIPKLTWDEYLNVIGNVQTHKPGASYPVDPIAARKAKEEGVTFVIVEGGDIINLKKAIVGEEFKGSVIS